MICRCAEERRSDIGWSWSHVTLYHWGSVVGEGVVLLEFVDICDGHLGGVEAQWWT